MGGCSFQFETQVPLVTLLTSQIIFTYKANPFQKILRKRFPQVETEFHESIYCLTNEKKKRPKHLKQQKQKQINQ